MIQFNTPVTTTAGQPQETVIPGAKPAVMPPMAATGMAAHKCECKKSQQRNKLIQLLIIIAYILLIIYLYKQITK